MRCHMTIKIKKFTGPICFSLFAIVIGEMERSAFRRTKVSRMEAFCVSAASVARKCSRLDCLTLEMENNFKLGANSLQVILLHFNT